MKRMLLLSTLFTLMLSFIQLAHAAAPTNADILSILKILDKNEIAAAEVALRKSKNPGVKDFAQLMVHDHSENLRDTRKLGRKLQLKFIINPQAKTLLHQGKQELKELKALHGIAFEHQYINAMVKGHTAVLAMIDKEFIPHASGAEIKAFLLATRKVVAYHLARAKQEQKLLQ